MAPMISSIFSTKILIPESLVSNLDGIAGAQAGLHTVSAIMGMLFGIMICTIIIGAMKSQKTSLAFNITLSTVMGIFAVACFGLTAYSVNEKNNYQEKEAQLQLEREADHKKLSADIKTAYLGAEPINFDGERYSMSSTSLVDRMLVSPYPNPVDSEPITLRTPDGSIIDDALLVREINVEDENIHHMAWIEVPVDNGSHEYVAYEPQQ